MQFRESSCCRSHRSTYQRRSHDGRLFMCPCSASSRLEIAHLYLDVRESVKHYLNSETTCYPCLQIGHPAPNLRHCNPCTPRRCCSRPGSGAQHPHRLHVARAPVGAGGCLVIAGRGELGLQLDGTPTSDGEPPPAAGRPSPSRLWLSP